VTGASSFRQLSWVIVSALIGWGVGLLNPLAGLIVGLLLGICGLFGPVWITYHHEE
jgi:hypothetical protein